ncbi:MAG: enolase C-terminal domain-like protein [Chthoniobacterales bacterium]
MMKVQIHQATIDFIDQPFLKPLQLSSGLITKATEARVSVTFRVGENEATGFGSIYLSDLWAWPGATPDRVEKDKAMRGLCTKLAENLFSFCGDEALHPLELGLRLHHALENLAPEMPILARVVCASPFDAAIHDAAGRALQTSAFRFYDEDEVFPSVDAYFPNGGACAAIRKLFQSPLKKLDAWWIIGAADDLEKTVYPAVKKSGIRSFKIKTLGRDNSEDARRTAEIFQAARSWGIVSPVLSIDANEANPNSAAVVDYLAQLEALDKDAYAALDYLEQPTSRDIVAYPQDWRDVTKRKPVLLDEGLTSLDLLPLVEEQGWSGLALKTCKGHSFSLASAAWAHERGLQLAQQDLTNPGYSAIHSFLFAAHVPTINGVEINSPQYTPAANEPWLPALSGLFQPQEGFHQLDKTDAFGFGSILSPKL